LNFAIPSTYLPTPRYANLNWCRAIS
jgi:hypothetical protein